MSSRHRPLKTRPHRKFNAENIRYVRTGLNLTQPEFGRIFGVTRRTVIRWEQGKHLPAPWKRKRRKFFALWDKHERWLEYVHQRDAECQRDAYPGE